MSGANSTLRVKCPGGIVTPAQLRKYAELSYAVGSKRLYPGSRQDLLLPGVDERKWERARPAYEPVDAEFLGREKHPNIVSSASAVDVSPGTSWVDEGVFREVLGSFYSRPGLKLGLIDPRQTLLPRFTSHLNFHAAEQPHQWRCFLRFPATYKIHPLRQRISSNRLAEYAAQLEQLLLSRAMHDPEQIDQQLDQLPGIFPAEPVKTPDAATNEYQNYDGFHNLQNRDGLWLGIYNNDEPFRYSLLVDLAVLATQHNLGALYLTPWRSLLVKHVRPDQQREWRNLLGRHKIKLRHSDLQLFWQLPDDWPADTETKQEIVRQLREQSAVSAGISFAITPAGSYHEATLSVEKNAGETLLEKFGYRETYRIKYRAGFDRMSKQLLTHEERVKKADIGKHLCDLMNRYYQGDLPKTEQAATAPDPATGKILYQCQSCKTIYDDAYGDPGGGVAPGAGFGLLPEDWRCPVCEGPKHAYALLPVCVPQSAV